MENFEGTIVLGADNLEKMMLVINKTRNDDENISQKCTETSALHLRQGDYMLQASLCWVGGGWRKAATSL